MSGTDFGQLAYMVLLLVAVAGYFLIANRNRIGQMLRYAVLWGLIFIGVIAAVGLWDNVRSSLLPMQSVSDDGQVISLPRAPDGHYYATLQINGTPERFLVDTGATDIVLTREVARELGIDPASLIYSGIAGTANGQVRTARVTLDEVQLGPVTDRNVRAMVNDGDMPLSLLGMAYLDRFSSLQISAGAMTLTR